MRRKWAWLSGAVIVVIAGFKAPPYFIDTGISQFSGEIERSVAANSIASAHKAMSGSFGALLATAYRVTEVTPAVEPCDGSPNMFEPAGKYASRVQIYTIFGLRYQILYLICGGDHYSIYPLE